MTEAHAISADRPDAEPGVRLGILCGIEREGRIALELLRGSGVQAFVRYSGATAEGGRRAARALIDEGASRLLSFGVAGALTDDMRPGDLLLPELVLTQDDERFEPDPSWRAAAAAGIPDAREANLLGLDLAARTVGQKVFLGAAFDAAAVDMESHHLARTAVEHGLPFLVVRAIADDRRSLIPRAAMVGVGPDGRERPFQVLSSLAHRPNEIKALIKLAFFSGKAFRTLRRVGRAGLGL
ncbi:MAG: hypothetical protein ACMVY4_11840 [Minwuia sp.]|uniref:phosphorylase family protein n=1 Tax=Minwuia sp. TaxID=2493630 RepID=UPI003A8B5B70